MLNPSLRNCFTKLLEEHDVGWSSRTGVMFVFIMLVRMEKPTW